MTKQTWKPKPPITDPPPPYTPSSSTNAAEETTPLLSSRPSPSITSSSLLPFPPFRPTPGPEEARRPLLRAYHRALDAVAARGWRPPAIRWPGADAIVVRIQSVARRDRGCGRGTGRRCGEGCGRKKKRRRKLLLCVSLLVWVLIALGIAVWVKRWGRNRGNVILPVPRRTVRVAIVGAGPAGVSAAYTLSTSFKSPDTKLEIILFEQKERIGGRMELDSSLPTKALGRSLHTGDVAAGGVGGNVLRDRARTQLGIEFDDEGKGRGKDVGFFDGRSIVAKVTRPLEELGWGAWLALVWKYKFSFLNAKELPTGTMASFGRLLRSQAPRESVNDMVKAAGLGSVVGMSAVERLRINGIGGNYVEEVLEPQIWRQTGQGVEELSDLAISIALERETGVSATDGGNLVMILEKFLKRSKAELKLGTRVTGLRREFVGGGKKSWILEYRQGGHHGSEYETFDHIILAGPWNTSSFLHEHRQVEEVYYRSLWITFLLSSKELNGDYFGTSGEMPSQMLPIPSANLPSELQGVHEISYVRDIFGPDVNTEAVRRLYRILSDRPLSKDHILAFGEGAVLESHEERIENAYPLMWPRKGKFGEFKVQEGLWHTGVVEGIGSSVDLSWVTGDNVGRLVGRETGRKRF